MLLTSWFLFFCWFFWGGKRGRGRRRRSRVGKGRSIGGGGGCSGGAGSRSEWEKLSERLFHLKIREKDSLRAHELQKQKEKFMCGYIYVCVHSREDEPERSSRASPHVSAPSLPFLYSLLRLLKNDCEARNMSLFISSRYSHSLLSLCLSLSQPVYTIE